jgi:peptidyl-prolyl cis-trans isomerase B (cyclophilin B)
MLQILYSCEIRGRGYAGVIHGIVSKIGRDRYLCTASHCCRYHPRLDIVTQMTSVQIQTSKGNININLFDHDAPITVTGFLFLLKQGFYNGLTFHRVVPNFLIQGGDPLGTGMGTPARKGIKMFPYQGKNVTYPTKDEFFNTHLFTKPGMLAMAGSSPPNPDVVQNTLNSNGSQFFITQVPAPQLNNKYTIFGEVMTPKDQAVVNNIKKGDKINRISIS